MKFIDPYRDPDLVLGLLEGIEKTCGRIGRPVSVMEVCGTHTMAIGRYGLRRLLPREIRLISGPGCPVCVTAMEDVDRALHLAGRTGVLFATFGDMLRVPGTGGRTLQKLRADGADVRVVLSPLDVLALAEGHPERQVVFMAIGFETTAPATASLLIRARDRNLENLTVLSTHKVIPPAMKALVEDRSLNLDGFLCPGHVSTIIGSGPYGFLPEKAGACAVITGFEPVDILEGLLMVLRQIEKGVRRVEIQYTRAVNPGGNPRALAVLEKVFRAGPSRWRGLGDMADSGLFIGEPYSAWDAARRFSFPDMPSAEIKGCSCGAVLRGVMEPSRCPHFRTRCTPSSPLGPCMVSSEGTCAAFYRYDLENRNTDSREVSP